MRSVCQQPIGQFEPKAQTMKKLLLFVSSLMLTMASDVTTCFADNPFVQTIYTADPAPFVYNGVLYAYLDHDEDGTYGWFQMKDWRLFSTTDVVNWTDHGVTASLATFSWGRVDAWAGQVVNRNGKFYYYVPIRIAGNPFGIGVGVSDKPEGPFTDAIGKPLVTGDGYIDPTVFVDDDGQAYLYWGNPTLNMVKLNADMISYSGSIVKVPMTAATVNNMYLEGPWFYKRNGLYYLLYSTQNNGTPGKEDIRYSTSTGPTGPWAYRGLIQPVQVGGKSWTNHCGVVDYKGNSYFFYHTGDLPGGSDFTRSACVEQFSYNADGTIPTIPMTKTGPIQIGHLNPFDTTQAETIAFSSGLKTEVCTDAGGGMDVTSINNGDYIKLEGVDFGSGATSFDARVASGATGGNIELHLDSITGTLIGTCTVQGTGGVQTWATKSCTVTGATGIHDLFFKFAGSGTGNLFNFNWWKFSGPGATGNGDAGVGGASSTGGATSGSGGRGGSSGTSGVGGSTRSTGGTLNSGGGSSGIGGTPNIGGTSNSSGGSIGIGGARTIGGTSTNSGGSIGSASTGGENTTGTGGSIAIGGSSSGKSSLAAGGSGDGGRSDATGGTKGTELGGSGGSNSGSGGFGVGGQIATHDAGSGSSGCSCRTGSRHGDGPLAIVAMLLGTLLLGRRKVGSQPRRESDNYRTV
jgi:arabinoxylan arabinofuranohydrolase